MPSDPGLASDTCIYMEAVQGDGGTHSTSGVWWLSPDIKLTGATSGADMADPGQNNTVEVKFHRKGAQSRCTMPAAESITVQLYIGNPSLAMSPDNPASTTQIQNIGVPTPAEGTTTTKVFDWSPPKGLPPSDPQGAGHKCIIARCFPDPLVPDPSNFFAPEDQHVAQRNICIVPCGGPGAARKPGPCGLNVSTLNLNKKSAEELTLRAVADLNPNEYVRRVVLEKLKTTQGFQRLAHTPPKSFRLELPDFRDAKVIDNTRVGCLGVLLGSKRQPSYEAKLRFQPGQFTSFSFNADMAGARFGDAYIFHLRQIGADGRDQGGLTIVMVAV